MGSWVRGWNLMSISPPYPWEPMQPGGCCKKHKLHGQTSPPGSTYSLSTANPYWSFTNGLDCQQFLQFLCLFVVPPSLEALNAGLCAALKFVCCWTECRWDIAAQHYWQFYIFKNVPDSPTEVLMRVRSAHSWFLSEILNKRHGMGHKFTLWLRHQTKATSTPKRKSLLCVQ